MSSVLYDSDAPVLTGAVRETGLCAVQSSLAFRSRKIWSEPTVKYSTRRRIAPWYLWSVYIETCGEDRCGQLFGHVWELQHHQLNSKQTETRWRFCKNKIWTYKKTCDLMKWVRTESPSATIRSSSNFASMLQKSQLSNISGVIYRGMCSIKSVSQLLQGFHSSFQWLSSLH